MTSIKVYLATKNPNFKLHDDNRPIFVNANDDNSSPTRLKRNIVRNKQTFDANHFGDSLGATNKYAFSENSTFEATLTVSLKGDENYEKYRKISYCMIQINTFKKYYFITEMVVKNTNTITYTLHLDTITTYFSELKFNGLANVDRKTFKYNDVPLIISDDTLHTQHFIPLKKEKMDVLAGYPKGITDRFHIWALLEKFDDTREYPMAYNWWSGDKIWSMVMPVHGQTGNIVEYKYENIWQKQVLDLYYLNTNDEMNPHLTAAFYAPLPVFRINSIRENGVVHWSDQIQLGRDLGSSDWNGKKERFMFPLKKGDFFGNTMENPDNATGLVETKYEFSIDPAKLSLANNSEPRLNSQQHSKTVIKFISGEEQELPTDIMNWNLRNWTFVIRQACTHDGTVITIDYSQCIKDEFKSMRGNFLMVFNLRDQVPTVSDNYAKFKFQQGSSYKTGMNNTIGLGVMDSMLQPPKSPDPIGAVVGAVGGLVKGLAHMGAEIEAKKAMVRDIKRTGQDTKWNDFALAKDILNFENYFGEYGDSKFALVKYGLNENDQKTVETHYLQYGVSTNWAEQFTSPLNFLQRHDFNYWKIQNISKAIDKSAVSSEITDYIDGKMRLGIRFWTYGMNAENKIGDYTVRNSDV